jgi:hypothetical protein
LPDPAENLSQIQLPELSRQEAASFADWEIRKLIFGEYPYWNLSSFMALFAEG